MRTIGVDVGGTKMLAVALDPTRPTEVLAEHRVPTPPAGAGLVDALGELIELIDGSLGGPADAIGIGVPGLVDRDGVLHVGAHLAKVDRLPLGAGLRTRTGRVVAVDNDANGHAVGEHRAGAAVGVDDALVVTLGTGIGAGCIVDGRLLRGAHGFAGEPGHMVVDPTGPPCPCGRRGCWERFASGTGLGRLARDAALGGRLDAAVELAGGNAEAVLGEHVTAAARSGDREALAVLDEFARWIAIGLANLINVLDPSLIVIGGGVVEAADLVLPAVCAQVTATVLGHGRRPDVPIVAAGLGERAGAIGLALLAADAVDER
jgi:glucokinase